ncbi:carboxylesterase from carbohydrate esterase [Irpex rosettiformis]|uniref:Carboxylesterase from carbohydrate esterase n=1 Tax=Irpex rosettiformis TaxID=378272 RepID=A0ACB8U846_9APHY|nr:carboxylesterase from carbohydrate esterase [Irpex rosettiformis]
MVVLFVLLLAVTGLVAHAETASRETASAESDATLLLFNDLDRASAASHQSILLLGAQTNSAAQDACAVLNESLLPNNSSVFGADLVHLLQYQVYQKRFAQGQNFWIASESPACQTVDTSGKVGQSSCNKVLPALCSQSANLGAEPSNQNKLSISSQGLTITGFRDQRAFRFYGIPYANPPARWTYPSAYTGPRSIDATKFGAACIQAGSTDTSEDCLFLNIMTPFVPRSASPSKSSLKPVMFWIHGGAFTSGTGADSTFEGGNMVSRGDVVLVTTNYRLSTLGFLALSDGKTNGNFGLADIIAALEWVNQHVPAFGGDPDRITIFGQSAGAAAVRSLLQSPKAIGLYAAAIQMSNLAGSGYGTTYSNYYTIEEEVAVAARNILQQTNCNKQSNADTLACLKNVDANTLVNLGTVARYIVVDGTYIQHPFLPLDGSARVANVHTMIGFMRDDGAAFISAPTSDNAAAALASAGLPAAIANSALFPLNNGAVNATENLFNFTVRASTDAVFRCLDQATAVSGVKHRLFKDIWFYEFNRSYQTSGYDPNAPRCDAPADVDHPAGNPDREYYKCHSGELYYVFGTLPANRPYRDANDLPFTQLSLDAWTSFARTFNPNPDPAFLEARGFADTAKLFASQPQWDPVTSQNVDKTPLRQLQVPSFMTVFKEKDQCDFLNYPLSYWG